MFVISTINTVHCSGSLEPETLWSLSEALHEKLEAASVAVYLYVITIEAVTLMTPKIQLYPDGYRICILRVCDCGLPYHGPVDWSRGLTSLDWPCGLAGSRGWFRCLSPWNHMTIESDLSPRVHRSGHGLFPRINWEWERLNMRRILIPTSVIFVLKGTDDKTLQLV